jgi:FkbM family methyltransferase
MNWRPFALRNDGTYTMNLAKIIYEGFLREKQHWRHINKIRHCRIVDVRRLHALHEQEHLRRLLEYLSVDCVFDVGASAGQYARMLRRETKFAGRIISFEPIPWRANEMRRAAAHDDLWTIENIALASTTGEGQFNVMAANQFSSLGTPIHDDTRFFIKQNVIERRINVRKETLESAYRRLKNMHQFKRPFLKMDTQGFHITILKSGADIACQFVGLQSELAIKRVYQESVDFREAISIYNEFGFHLSAFVPNNSGHFPHLIETDCIMVRSDLMPQD